MTVTSGNLELGCQALFRGQKWPFMVIICRIRPGTANQRGRINFQAQHSKKIVWYITKGRGVDKINHHILKTKSYGH
jgi:hypothetical protein